MKLLKIILKNGLPLEDDKEVILTTLQKCILKGKGEGGFILMKEENVKYKEKDDRNNNK